MSMKKLFVYAFMAGNFGDDLMVWILCKRYPEVRFWLWADESYQERFRELKNVRVFSQNSRINRGYNYIIRKILKRDDDFFRYLIRKSSAVIHIGGSIYMQHDNYQVTMSIDKALRSYSKKMYVCGANFGPYYDDKYFQEYFELFKLYDGICFRDTDSYKLFHTLSNIRCAPDVAFNCPVQYAADNNTDNKTVLISILSLEERETLSRYTEQYECFMHNVTEWYIKKGYSVTLVSLCDAQGDCKAAKKIRSLSDCAVQKQIKICSYKKDISEILLLFAEADIVIGTRFHSIILGWMNHTYVLPIVYDLKTRNVLRDMGWTNYLEMDELKDVNLDICLNRLEKLSEEKLGKAISKAKEQFQDIDNIL